MSDAMSEMYKMERQWKEAKLLLDCYYGRNNNYTTDKAVDLIQRKFDRTPESLERYMKA
jgi:tRNA splicing ligase